jgi:hypothetical protein
VLCAVITTATAVALRDYARIASSAAGVAALLLAVTGGLRFLRHQHNDDSYLMAAGFLVATVTFASGAILNERRSRRGASAH